MRILCFSKTTKTKLHFCYHVLQILNLGDIKNTYWTKYEVSGGQEQPLLTDIHKHLHPNSTVRHSRRTPMYDLWPAMSFSGNWLSISMETPRGHGEWTSAPDMRNEPNYSFWEVIICALWWQGPINNVGFTPRACSVIEEQWGGERGDRRTPYCDIASSIVVPFTPEERKVTQAHGAEWYQAPRLQTLPMSVCNSMVSKKRGWWKKLASLLVRLL